jgi:predicted XRE-type DNA-binding protein
MKERKNVTTDNIFADLGLEDSEEMVTRSDLMSEVASLIRKSSLTQKEVAKILGISTPKVSALMNGKINDFSNDTLLNYLAMLGCNVEIRILPQRIVNRSVKRGKIKIKRSTIKKRRSRAKVKV